MKSFKDYLSEAEQISEKSVSKSQQQAAGIALAAKRGDMPKSKLKGASKEMSKMSTKDLEDFAKTKHKGLPKKVKEDGPDKADIPAYKRKEKGGDWKVSQKDLDDKEASTMTTHAGLKKREKEMQGVAETSDYFRRRKREEAIIGGQKPARKKQPAQTSDYARRREQEKKKEQGVAEAAGLYGPFTVTIQSGERPTSRTKTKKFKREDDAILWTEDWFEDHPQYVYATAEITDPEGNVVWYSDETMASGQGVAEGTGFAIKRQNGEWAKSAKTGTPIWFSNKEHAHKANAASHGGEGKVVPVKLKRAAYAHNGRTIDEHSLTKGEVSGQGVAEAKGSTYEPLDISVVQWAQLVRERFPGVKIYKEPEELGGTHTAYVGKEFVGDWDGGGDGPAGRIKMQGVAEANSEDYNGIQLSLEVEKDDEYVDDEDTDNQTIYVKATANGRELGHVLFTIDYDSQGMVLNPQDLEVDERFRGQGIAATMYDYVKSKGYRIRRSGQQTDAGAGFWDKHKPGKNIWEQGVAESNSEGEDLTEGVLTDSVGDTMAHIMQTFGPEVKKFVATDELDDDLYNALYDYYYDDMPYGVKKARSGDPYEWVADRFYDDLKDQGMVEETVEAPVDNTELDDLARLAGLR